MAAAVPAGGWAENGLGDWTIRDLVGHTGRALSTVSEYATDRVEPPELIRDSQGFVEGQRVDFDFEMTAEGGDRIEMIEVVH